MNQKRIGKSCKHVLALSLGLALTGCNLFHEATDAEHVARAKEYLDKNDYRSSSIELKSALEKNPGNAEARRLLGEINVVIGNGEAAEKELRKSIELGVAREAVLLHLVEAMALQGKHQAILDQVDVPAGLDVTDQAKLAAYRGNAWLALNKVDQARGEYEKALQLDSSSALGKLGLARLAAMKREVDKALQLSEEALQIAPEEAKIWSFQGDLYQSGNELEKAEASYSKALELRLRNQVDRANRALVRLGRKDLEGARNDIEILKKEASKLFLTHYADGLLALRQRKYPEAQAAFERSSKLNERHLLTTYFLGVSHLMQNHLSQADQNLMRFMRAAPRSVKVYQMLALSKFRQKDYVAAKKLLQPVVVQFPEDAASLRLMGNIEFALGESAKGLEYLRKVTELSPNSASARVQLGLGLLTTGDEQEGLETLETAVELDPETDQTNVLLILSQIRAKEFDKALERVGELKKKMPNNPVPMNLEGIARAGQGDHSGAEAAFKEALKLSPGDPTAAHHLAALAIKSKKLDEARQYFQQVINVHPDHLETLIKLSEISALAGDRAKAEAALNQAVKAYPQSLQPNLILARYYLQYSQPTRSLEIVRQIKERYPNHPSLLAVIGEAQLIVGETANALNAFQRLVTVQPESAQAHYLLAKAHAAANNSERVRAELKEALRLNPGHLLSKVAMTRRLMLDNKPREAEKLFGELKQAQPENPEIFGLEGWLAMRQQKAKEAIAAFTAALQRYPNSNWTVNLAEAQWLDKDMEGGLATLEKWLKDNPEDVQVQFSLANAYLTFGRESQAKTAFTKLNELAPNNIIVLNNLAWLLRKEKPALALKYAEKAFELAPNGAMIMDTLGTILLEQNQFERAERLLRQASEITPQSLSIRYRLARALAGSGNKAEARRVLSALLGEKKPFPEQKAARSLLSQLGS